jgi:hypothetical protein
MTDTLTTVVIDGEGYEAPNPNPIMDKDEWAEQMEEAFTDAITDSSEEEGLEAGFIVGRYWLDVHNNGRNITVYEMAVH